MTRETIEERAIIINEETKPIIDAFCDALRAHHYILQEKDSAEAAAAMSGRPIVIADIATMETLDTDGLINKLIIRRFEELSAISHGGKFLSLPAQMAEFEEEALIVKDKFERDIIELLRQEGISDLRINGKLVESHLFESSPKFLVTAIFLRRLVFHALSNNLHPDNDGVRLMTVFADFLSIIKPGLVTTRLFHPSSAFLRGLNNNYPKWNNAIRSIISTITTVHGQKEHIERISSILRSLKFKAEKFLLICIEPKTKYDTLKGEGTVGTTLNKMYPIVFPKGEYPESVKALPPGSALEEQLEGALSEEKNFENMGYLPIDRVTCEQELLIKPLKGARRKKAIEVLKFYNNILNCIGAMNDYSVTYTVVAWLMTISDCTQLQKLKNWLDNISEQAAKVLNIDDEFKKAIQEGEVNLIATDATQIETIQIDLQKFGNNIAQFDSEEVKVAVSKRLIKKIQSLAFRSQYMPPEYNFFVSERFIKLFNHAALPVKEDTAARMLADFAEANAIKSVPRVFVFNIDKVEKKIRKLTASVGAWEETASHAGLNENHIHFKLQIMDIKKITGEDRDYTPKLEHIDRKVTLIFFSKSIQKIKNDFECERTNVDYLNRLVDKLIRLQLEIYATVEMCLVQDQERKVFDSFVETLGVYQGQIKELLKQVESVKAIQEVLSDPASGLNPLGETHSSTVTGSQSIPPLHQQDILPTAPSTPAHVAVSPDESLEKEWKERGYYIAEVNKYFDRRAYQYPYKDEKKAALINSLHLNENSKETILAIIKKESDNFRRSEYFYPLLCRIASSILDSKSMRSNISHENAVSRLSSDLKDKKYTSVIIEINKELQHIHSQISLLEQNQDKISLQALVDQLQKDLDQFILAGAKEEQWDEFKENFHLRLHTEDDRLKNLRKHTKSTVIVNVCIALTGIGLLLMTGKFIRSVLTGHAHFGFFTSELAIESTVNNISQLIRS